MSEFINLNAGSPEPTIIDGDQGGKKWKTDRSGLVTASMACVVKKRLKSGEFSGAAQKYAFRLAIERITGTFLDDTFETEYMRRGTRLEEDARVRHEQRIGDLIEQVSLVISPCGRYGASPDGFIRSDGGAEYKCFVSPEKLMPILINGDVSDIQDQMQMNMWLTGREWWHFGLYCPALKAIDRDLTIIPTERNETYIDALKKDLAEFDCLVQSYQQQVLDNNHDSLFMPPEPGIAAIQQAPAETLNYEIQL